LVCFLPSYLAFVYLISLLFYFTFLTKKKKIFFFFFFFFFFFIFLFSLHMQKKGRLTSVGGAHSKSKEFHIPQLVDEREHITPPPPPGFALSTAAENEASVSPPPSFAPSTAPADEVRVSPPPGFAPSTETVADEVRVSPPPPLVLLIKKDFRWALYYLKHGVCHSEP
jgi:hypothetical protein